MIHVDRIEAMTDRTEVYREYVLITGGADPEIDALHIVMEVTKDLDIEAKKRVVNYLLQRFSLTVL